MEWECITDNDAGETCMMRHRTPDGWLVKTEHSGSITYVPDAEGTWDPIPETPPEG